MQKLEKAVFCQLYFTFFYLVTDHFFLCIMSMFAVLCAMHWAVVVVVHAFISQIIREQFGDISETVPCPSSRA